MPQKGKETVRLVLLAGGADRPGPGLPFPRSPARLLGGGVFGARFIGLKTAVKLAVSPAAVQLAPSPGAFTTAQLLRQCCEWLSHTDGENKPESLRKGPHAGIPKLPEWG
ncbi:hypothetical protein SKAU_G00303700 [Synaphobranchus kaupii]|uniref:Uncharacterized protein n=1 Tax=Synaphobranchus kaupii TaxID=118154 RepID=A0A9Q1EW61_SYNKA|nr:hypothetical protein SKAU_G00303700 [Synaphobranchus kaupii]